MQISVWLILCGVLLLFILVDVLGHKLLKVSRTIAHWALLVVLVASTIVSGVMGVRSLTGTQDQRDSNLYLAYRYLLSGEGDNAQEKADLCPDSPKGHDKLISLFAEAVDGDYIGAYFTATRLLEEGQVDAVLQSSVQKVQDIAAQMLGFDQEGGKELPLVGVSTQEDTTVVTLSEEDAQSQIAGEIDLCFQDLNLSAEQQRKYQAVFELDAMLNTDDVSQLDSSAVEEMLAAYPNDTDMLKLGAKYYMSTGRYDEAKACAYQLVQTSRNEESYVIYTDVIAQTVADQGLSAGLAEDSEVKSLLAQAETLQQQADEMQPITESDEERRDELQNLAQDLQEQAAQVEINRAINYLIAKKPLLGDDTGLLDLQIAKLYLAVDDRDTAREYIHQMVGSSGSIRQDSPIKEPLLEVVDAYNQSTSDEASPLLDSAVHQLVVAESQDVVTVTEGNINGELSNYITSTLKYDRISVHISKVDTTNYPAIRAYANINGTKENTFGLASDFEKGDFELIDTQYQIQDFQIVSSEENSQINIAVVMDNSGSMSGTPLDDAKLAAEACINNMDTATQKLAIITYSNSANVDVGLTSAQATLTSGVRAIQSAGGTNISAGILAGLDTLSNVSGTRAIILLTDGQDGNTGAIEETIQKAQQAGVAIYAVGFGDVNSEYMRNIAQSTGGKFIYAANSTELSDIYITLQKYIVNNYCFEYTVTQNVDTDPRSLTVNVPSYQTSDQKAYRISGDPVEEGEDTEGIQQVEDGELAIFSVTPGGVSAKDLQKGGTVTIQGSGFSDGLNVSVGDLAVTDLRVTDANTATGTLRGDIPAGKYAVRVTLPDGRVDMKNEAFLVFRAGSTKSVRLGTTTILADNIGQIDDNTFWASGNVSINNFLHSAENLEIKADALPADFDINSSSSPYLGENGTISGDGKLYISYQQAKEVAEDGGAVQNVAANAFAELVMDGKDYIVKNGEFNVSVNGTTTEFTDSMYDFDVKIPNMAPIQVAKCTLYADRLQIDASTLDVSDIIDTVKTGLSGGAAAEKKASKPYTSKEEAFKFDGIEGSLSMALSADDIRVGGEVKLKVNDAINFQYFGIRDFSIKFNTLDPNQEYWKIGGAIDFSKIVPGLGGTGVEGFEASLGSYYWYPDSVTFQANLNPGIPIYKVVYLDELGGKVEGISTIVMWAQGLSEHMQKALGTDINIDEVSQKDVILAGTVGADINLFKSLSLPASEEISRWGELGALDGEIGFNCSELEFYAEADLSILQAPIANATVRLGKPGFEISGGVSLDVSAFGVALSGGVELGAKATSNSGGIWLAGDASLSCSWTHTNWDGDVRLEFNVEDGGDLIEVSMRSGGQFSRFWYDKNSSAVFFNRFHTESNF